MDRSRLEVQVGCGAPGNEPEDVHMNDVLEHLEDISRMTSGRWDEAELEVQRCLESPTDARFFGSSGNQGSPQGEGVV